MLMFGKVCVRLCKFPRHVGGALNLLCVTLPQMKKNSGYLCRSLVKGRSQVRRDLMQPGIALKY